MSDSTVERCGRKSKDADGLHRRKNKSGIGFAWYFGYRDPVDQRWHEVSTGTSDFAEARRVRTRKLAEIEAGILPTNKSKLKLRPAFTDWMEDASLHYEASTVRLHRERSAPLLDLLGHMRLGKISIDTVRSYQRTRAKLVSNRTVNLEVQTLRNVMKHYGTWRGTLREDYCSLPEPKSGVGRVLSDDEEKRCWNVAKTAPNYMRTYNLSVLVGNTGLRRSELLGLHIEQLDLEGGEIWVRKSKTDAGRRHIPLNEHAIIAATMVLELARERSAVLPEHYLFPANLSSHTREDDPLFEKRGYDPNQHQKTFRTAWRNFTRKCGLKGLRVHDRRHHFVTLLAEQDVPPEAAMSIVGHMSPEMLRHYTHIRDGVKRAAVKKLEAVQVVSPAELKTAMAAAASGGGRRPPAPVRTATIIPFAKKGS